MAGLVQGSNMLSIFPSVLKLFQNVVQQTVVNLSLQFYLSHSPKGLQAPGVCRVCTALFSIKLFQCVPIFSISKNFVQPKQHPREVVEMVSHEHIPNPSASRSLSDVAIPCRWLLPLNRRCKVEAWFLYWLTRACQLFYTLAFRVWFPT